MVDTTRLHVGSLLSTEVLMKKLISIGLALACASLGAEVLQPMSGIGALSDSDTDAEYHEHEILGFTVQIRLPKK